jgi:hypothetical protein
MTAFVYVYQVFLIQKIQLHKKHWTILFSVYIFTLLWQEKCFAHVCMYVHAYLLKFITREERQNEWAADCMSSLVLAVL